MPLLWGWEGVRCEASWAIVWDFADPWFFLGFGPTDQKVQNLEKCPGPQQQSRSSFDSSFNGYFSDGVFTFSGSQVPVDPEKILAGGVFWANTGKCAISKQKSAQKACFCYSEALIGSQD